MSKNLPRMKRMLFTSVLMLLISVFSVFTATYAWFETLARASVTSFEVTAGITDGVSISAKPDVLRWANSLSVSDFNDSFVGNKNIIPGGNSENTLGPVSSAGIVTNGYLQFYLAHVNWKNYVEMRSENITVENGGLAVGSASGSTTAEPYSTDAHYFAVDMFLNVSNAYNGRSLFLNSRSFVEDETPNSRVSCSVRVAFVHYGATAKDNHPENLSEVESITIWEPNADVHLDAYNEGYFSTTYALCNSTPSYLADTDYLDYRDYIRSSSSSVDSGDFYFAQAIPSNVLLQTRASEQVWSADTTPVATLQGGINRIRVYIWLEGQDEDNLDSVHSQRFAANLQFEVPKLD